MKKQFNDYFIGSLYILIAYVSWGLLPLFWKLLDSISAKEILANRILWSFFFLLILTIIKKRFPNVKNTLFSHRNKIFFLQSSLLITAHCFNYHWSVKYIQHIESSLVYYINHLISEILRFLIMRDKLYL